MTLKVDLSMESKMYGFPQENDRFHVVFGGGGFGGPAEITLKVDLNMESKMYGFAWENDRFHESLGERDLEDSQKSHLKLTSVWRAKCLDLQGK